jgi:REP element-mobilizing transposase RayT
MKQTSRDLVHRLAYSWTGWPQSEPLPPEPAADFLAALDAAWSCDGLHRISHRWEPDIVQFTFEAGPDISPQTIAARAKGRLDHALRAHGWRAGLARKVALRSLGENTLETVLHYIATQIDRADLADPRYVQSLATAAWSDGDVDFSEPLASGHGRYWYNLHLVAVTDERWRVGREDFLVKIPAAVRAWSLSLGAVDTSSVGRDKPVRAVGNPRSRNEKLGAADGLAPSERNRPRPGVHSLAVMPDHVHVSVRASTNATPRSVADALRRALNLAAGCALFSARMYAGTFSDYALSAIRQRP